MQFLEIEWQSDLYSDEIALRDKLLRAPLGLIFTDEDLAEESSHLHFGMMEGASLIACAVIVPLSASEAKLRQMAVEDTYQRQGVGSILIDHIESALRERHFHIIELNARQHAIEFYERLGYCKQGSAFIEVSISHWKMTKSI
jgi:predicted GNAT family N-acyltransferase